MSLPDTFWAKAKTTDCIVWTGAQNNKGYGCFGINGKSQLAHRLVWEEAHGPIPAASTPASDSTISSSSRWQRTSGADPCGSNSAVSASAATS
jgi:hypothetical protein